MCATNILVIIIVFVFLAKIMNNLANKLLQVEVIKKAKTFEEAKNFWIKDIWAEQNFEKKVVEEEKDEFLKNIKKEPTFEEKEEMDWQNVR